MPLDPSIILSAKPVQIANPLDMATKALTLKDLSQRSALQDQQIANDQAIKNAFANNVSKDASGNLSLNRQGVLSDLYKVAPDKAMAYQQNFQKMDFDKIKGQAEVAKQLAFSIPSDPTVPLDQKQAAWERARNLGIKYGLPNGDTLPLQYPGDDYVNHMKFVTLSAKDQLDQKYKAQQLAIEQQKADAAKMTAGITNNKNQTMAEYYKNRADQAKLSNIQRAKTNILKDPQILKYQTAFQRIDNMDSLFNKVKSGDLKATSQLLGDLNNEYTSVLTGQNSPPLGRQERAEYQTYQQELAGLAQKISGSPQDIGSREVLNQLKKQIDLLRNDYTGFMKDRTGQLKGDYRSMPDVQRAQDETLNLLLKGNSPKSLMPPPLTDQDFNKMSDDDLDELYQQMGGQ